MAQREHQKVKGCRKCGRNARKEAAKGGVLSQFVRGKISAHDYFKAMGLSVKGA